MKCDQHENFLCTLQCSVAECESYECEDAAHRWSPWLHRRDWEAIVLQAHYNEQADGRVT